MRFIAYFDYLGFATVTEHNPISDLNLRIEHSSRDIEFALAHNKHSEIRNPDGSVPADLSNIKCNCVRFSDTVIFYSDKFDSSTINSTKNIYQLIDIIKVCYQYNEWSSHMYPARGCLIIGEMEHDYLPLSKGNKENKFHYYRNAVYGKGLLDSYKLGEAQNWAGAFASNDIIELLAKNGYIDIISQYFIQYRLPINKRVRIKEEENSFKIVEEKKLEHCFRLVNKTQAENRNEWHKNRSESITRAFEYQQPLPLPNSVLKKLSNTLDFFKHCLEN